MVLYFYTLYQLVVLWLLGWLIHFKLAIIVYKALTLSSPTYLSTLLHSYRPVHSADQQLLESPHSRTKFGSRAFRRAAPSVWKKIPLSVRSAPSISTFKNHLQTYYFTHPPA